MPGKIWATSHRAGLYGTFDSLPRTTIVGIMCPASRNCHKDDPCLCMFLIIICVTCRGWRRTSHRCKDYTRAARHGRVVTFTIPYLIYHLPSLDRAHMALEICAPFDAVFSYFRERVPPHLRTTYLYRKKIFIPDVCHSWYQTGVCVRAKLPCSSITVFIMPGNPSRYFY